MGPTVFDHRTRPVQCLAFTVLLLLATSCSAAAQGKTEQGVIGAILSLCKATSTCTGRTQIVTGGRLYGATVDAQITNADGSDLDFGTEDRINSLKVQRSGRFVCFPDPVSCAGGSGTKDQFKQWVKDNAGTLIDLLFPAGLSEGVSGRDAPQNHAQQFLLNTAMAVTSAGQAARLRQSEAGGLFEFEQFDEGDARSGIGVQGLYRMDGIHFSVLGRYAKQTQNETQGFAATTTNSFTIATDYHPSVVVYPSLDLRVGLDARTGLLYSRASAISLGSLDFGGGVWMAARKDFSRVRIGAGGLLQGSKSYIPTWKLGDDITFLADAVNKNPIAWDVSYGVIGGYAVTTKTSLNVKWLQTVPREPTGQDRPTSTIVMGSVSYLVGGLTPVDVGYKLYTSGGITAHSIFLQGYFGF